MQCFENLYYALFIKRYQLQAKSVENGLRPVELVDTIFETNHGAVNSYLYLLIHSLDLTWIMAILSTMCQIMNLFIKK